MKLSKLIQTPGWYPDENTVSLFSDEQTSELLHALKNRFKILEGKKRNYNTNTDVYRIRFEIFDSELSVLSGVRSDGWIVNTERLSPTKLLNPNGSLWRDVKYYESLSSQGTFFLPS